MRYLHFEKTIIEIMERLTDDLYLIGAEDLDLDLFENQYPVPDGITYNSYLLLDEQTAIFDTVDRRCGAKWLADLEEALGGRTPDYLIVHHMEPDHSACIADLLARYPSLRIVATERAIRMLPLYFADTDFTNRTVAVGEGGTLSLGRHTLRFLTAPMVHWPEVMVSYDETDRTLFSADAFGTFGIPSRGEAWPDEARRYYYNICGKYGVQVQALLRKASALEIARICPLHGPVLTTNLASYFGWYDLWSRCTPESDGVLVAVASIHGCTAAAAEQMAEMLRKKGAGEVEVLDLCRCDLSQAVSEAFRLRRLVLAASSYDGGLFPPMHAFLHHLQQKGFGDRSVALVENGSWAPVAARVMGEMLSGMKRIRCVGTPVTLRGRLRQENQPALEALAEALLAGA